MIRKHISTAASAGLLAVALLSPAAAAEPAKASPPASVAGSVTLPVDAQLHLRSDEQKTLYALGLAMAQNLDRLQLQEAELAYLVKGLQDGVLARPPQVELEEYAPKVQAMARQRMEAAGAREQAAADEYLARRSAEAGATRTGSGIVVLSRQEGSGPAPGPTDTVRVDYQGTLPDGTVFDSSTQRGESLSFALDEVIPCWTEVVQTMKVGGRAKVICPPALAYGSEGRPGIPPNSPLVFDIHLLGIGEPSTAAPGSNGEVDRDPLDQQVASLGAAAGRVRGVRPAAMRQ